MKAKGKLDTCPVRWTGSLVRKRARCLVISKLFLFILSTHNRTKKTCHHSYDVGKSTHTTHVNFQEVCWQMLVIPAMVVC